MVFVFRLVTMITFCVAICRIDNVVGHQSRFGLSKASKKVLRIHLYISYVDLLLSFGFLYGFVNGINYIENKTEEESEGEGPPPVRAYEIQVFEMIAQQIYQILN